MANTAYRDIPAKLAAREPFKGNSCHATLHGSIYTVTSYVTDVLDYDTATDAVTYWRGSYYSRTTSRLQKLLRAAFTIPTCDDCGEELDGVIRSNARFNHDSGEVRAVCECCAQDHAYDE